MTGSAENGPELGPQAELTDFERAVLELVADLAVGEIVTYGEVAAEIGFHGAARAVGSTLRRHGSAVAWWRVVAANGRLVPGSERRHADALAAEGVPINDGRVTMGSVPNSLTSGPSQ